MLGFDGDPEVAMRDVVELMRDMSRHTDPQELVTAYRQRVHKLVRFDDTMSLSRRDLSAPWYRVTRFSQWKEAINPWEQREKLPLLKGGVLADLIYNSTPLIDNDLKVSRDDPAYEYLKDYGSMFAIPHFDNGEGLNMVVSLRRVKDGFRHEDGPGLVWLSNMFGRTTHSLVLAQKLREAYAIVDRELQAVAGIQRALLPAVLPDVKGLRLAAHYQTSQQAGGDYYDLFPLKDGRLGLLIADVSGHGTPAAVLMAITHTVAHAFPGQPGEPGPVLAHLNNKLVEAYTRTPGGFVTAFYGVYDPASRELTYSVAGHNPPRVRREKDVLWLDGSRDLPLGIDADVPYGQAKLALESGDTLLMYTDGITEARAPGGPLFGEQRLDDTLRDAPSEPDWTIQHVVSAVEQFTSGAPATDDRTLVAASVR